MMEIINIFSKEINTKPITIQFAKDRKYEEAWIINRNDSKPSDVDIEEYLNDKFDLLIVEYIWQGKEDLSPFVLTVFLDKRCKLQDKKQFIKICLKLFYEYNDFHTLINNYNSQIIGFESLLSTPIEGIRIGVFNHWMSVGPINLWNAGEKLEMGIIKRKVHARPEIEMTELNFQSLLFIFNVDGENGYPFHGIKTPSCKKENKIWIVDYDKINYWISKLLVG